MDVSSALQKLSQRVRALENLRIPRGGVGGAITTRQVLLSVPGVLAPGVIDMAAPNHMGINFTTSGVYLDVEDAPTGANILVDVFRNGVTIFTVPANRPFILAGATSGYSTNVSVTAWNNNDIYTAEIVTVGSVVAGSRLTIAIRTVG